MGDDDDFLKVLEDENRDLKDKNVQLSTALSSTSYQGQDDSNLIQFQIDTGEMLGKIEHFLRGEYVAVDTEGNEYWAKPTIKIKEKGKEVEVIDDTLILFNDYGVNTIMSIIGNYLDKNTILSFYEEMRINEILADLGDELANFIFCNYEIIGMDTQFKKTRFQLIVINILHSIESTYRRAIKGKTMEDLNSSRIMTQLDNIGSKPQISTRKKFHLFKPNTW